jgi:ATPase family associated with various cellular activities (AAA)
MPSSLPQWAERLVTLYESQASNQFLLYGNVNDRFVLPLTDGHCLGSIYDFLRRVMMPRFDVVLSYDLGNGIRVDKGGDVLQKWPGIKETPDLPRAPRPAIEWLTRYFRYAANIARLGQEAPQIGFTMKAAHLVVPATQASPNYELSALALLMRDWADDDLARHALVTWLIADNRADVHPLLVNNPRTAAIEVPLPTAGELHDAIAIVRAQYPIALKELGEQSEQLAEQLVGATTNSIEHLLRITEHDKKTLTSKDISQLKKELVERDAEGLIDFIEPSRTLDDIYAQDALKVALRQDMALWRAGDVEAMPMGYLFCGPVGTGKTFMVECLAGEAGVPVVKLKNFRDKWVGSTEGNLEKIFRLLKSLGRCIVFIDEADQALGKRDSGANDSGLSGRIYSMFAEEMSNTANRGRIVWILASSRPDLIEVDLKRPGRVDVKVPIFPTANAAEGLQLLYALCKRRGVALPENEREQVEPMVPPLLTPGAAEAIAVKVYRTTKTENVSPLEALKRTLDSYQSPVPQDILDFQIALAAREASDVDFVPEIFRHHR